MLTLTLPLFGGGGGAFDEGPTGESLHIVLSTARRPRKITDQIRERLNNVLNIQAS
jgi:hypothetical protein